MPRKELRLTLYHFMQKFCKTQENIITCWFCERSEIVSMNVISRWMRWKKIIQTPLCFGQRSKCFGPHLDKASSSVKQWASIWVLCLLRAEHVTQSSKNVRNVNGQIIPFYLHGKKKVIIVLVIKEEVIFNGIANGQNTSPEIWHLSCFKSNLLSKSLWGA